MDEKLLDGVKAIADRFGLPVRATQHMIDSHGMPVVRIGRRIYGRAEAIGSWLVDREAAASVEGRPKAAGDDL